MAAMTNGIGWFEIGTDDPESAERFYGTLFGWAFTAEEDGPGGYRRITTPARDSIEGGLAPTGGERPNHAVFYVRVADTAATCVSAETAGGKVLVPPQSTPDGLVFAHLLDPSGNHFAIYTPAQGTED